MGTLSLLFDGQYALFILLMIALIISLTFHEWGHAFCAKLFGDNTAAQAGRLTINPVAHIDPMGLAMVALIGIGYAKPVPTNPANYTHRMAQLWVAAAGPFMNLVVAFTSWNLYLLLSGAGVATLQGDGAWQFFSLLVMINLLLMLFNLLPIGPLDGHSIMGQLLPPRIARVYLDWNARFGAFALLALVAAQLLGLPVFRFILGFAEGLIPWITIAN